MRSEFEKGDVVYCVVNGKGVVKSVNPSGGVKVVFEAAHDVVYYNDGSYLLTGPRVLFFSPPGVVPGATEKSKPPFIEPGTKVIAIHREYKYMYTFVAGQQNKEGDAVLDENDCGTFTFKDFEFYIVPEVDNLFSGAYVTIPRKEKE